MFLPDSFIEAEVAYRREHLIADLPRKSRRTRRGPHLPHRRNQPTVPPRRTSVD